MDILRCVAWWTCLYSPRWSLWALSQFHCSSSLPKVASTRAKHQIVLLDQLLASPPTSDSSWSLPFCHTLYFYTSFPQQFDITGDVFKPLIDQCLSFNLAVLIVFWLFGYLLYIFVIKVNLATFIWPIGKYSLWFPSFQWDNGLSKFVLLAFSRAMQKLENCQLYFIWLYLINKVEGFSKWNQDFNQTVHTTHLKIRNYYHSPCMQFLIKKLYSLVLSVLYIGY